jgi:hypothetical protein
MPLQEWYALMLMKMLINMGGSSRDLGATTTSVFHQSPPSDSVGTLLELFKTASRGGNHQIVRILKVFC